MRSAALVAVLVALASCGDSAAPPRPRTSSRPRWTVESVLFTDSYAEADGYKVVADPRAGCVIVTRRGEEAVRYVGVGNEVVRVTHEE